MAIDSVKKLMDEGAFIQSNGGTQSLEEAKKYVRSVLLPRLLIFGVLELLISAAVILLTLPGSAIDVEVFDDDFHRFSLFWSLFSSAILHLIGALMRLASAFIFWLFIRSDPEEDVTSLTRAITWFWSVTYQTIYTAVVMVWDVVAIGLVTAFAASSGKELDRTGQVFPAVSIGIMLVLMLIPRVVLRTGDRVVINVTVSQQKPSQQHYRNFSKV